MKTNLCWVIYWNLKIDNCSTCKIKSVQFCQCYKISKPKMKSEVWLFDKCQDIFCCSHITRIKIKKNKIKWWFHFHEHSYLEWRLILLISHLIIFILDLLWSNYVFFIYFNQHRNKNSTVPITVSGYCFVSYVILIIGLTLNKFWISQGDNFIS